LAAVQNALVMGALEAFQKFDHFGQTDFFDAYPIQISGPAFLNDATVTLGPWIDSLDAAHVKLLRNRYQRQIQPGPFLDKLTARYFTSTLAAAPVQPPDLATILGAVNASKENGFSVGAVPGARIAFVEVTSKTLLKEGQIEFPAQIQMDLPFEAGKVEVDQMLEMAERNLADYIVVLDVAAARVARRIVGKNDVESRYVSGSRSEPNPNYDIARSRVFEAQAGLANANAMYAQGILGAIAKGIAVGAWTNRVNEATASLSGTPSMLSIDLYEPYKYSASEVGTSRNLTANYFVIDKRSRRYFKSTFDVAESKNFRIAYNLHDKDPERGQVVMRFDKEADIATYEQSPMSLKVSVLVDDYLKHQGQSQPLQSLAQLRDEMLIDKNKALAEYKSKQFDAKPVNDDRFESVVVVLNPKGALGAGFYVAPDLVLTNFHVVEGAKFVEMRLRNGLETFGKIVKTDVRLDLALIKVQTVGKPVSMFSGNTLELGATVEAIGHPKGLTFTMTRGIVSALRKQQSVNAVGGKEVLFVQTDAAINPGNSGGPLFWKDKVIGVNNNKLVRGSEGLGFAVHYSEVAEFLKESF
jgi:serine protease Do